MICRAVMACKGGFSQSRVLSRPLMLIHSFMFLHKTFFIVYLSKACFLERMYFSFKSLAKLKQRFALSLVTIKMPIRCFKLPLWYVLTSCSL